MPPRVDVEAEATCELNVVERLGLGFLRRRIERKESDIHRWSPEDLSEIRRAERRAVGVAGLTGAVSGGILGALEIGVRWWLIDDPDAADWWEQLPSWSVYLALAVLVSGAEILFLYWNVLRKVAQICSIAGLGLADERVERAVGAGISRAALDLPNPRAPVYGIDPYARVPRWKLAAWTALYRLKVGMTSFVLRVLLRRVLARAALRFFIPLAAIPVFAVWNGVITWWAMREVRIRAAGPLAVRELQERMSGDRMNLDEEPRHLILEAVGEAVIRREDAHPNFVLLLTQLFQHLDVAPESLRIDWESNRDRLKELNPASQAVLLTTLAAATVLAGRPRRAQRELLDEAHAICGRSLQDQPLFELYRQFISGKGLSEETLKALGSRPAE